MARGPIVIVASIWLVLLGSLAAAITTERCTGDCNGDGRITVDELQIGIRQVFDRDDPIRCDGYERNRILPRELLEIAEQNALHGCFDDPSCGPPIDWYRFSALAILSGWPTHQVEAGGRTYLTLVTYARGFAEILDTCVDWSVSPTDAASIDHNGVLTADTDVPNGTLFAVTGDVARGRGIVKADVVVYTRDAAPLVGFWRESASFACGGEMPSTSQEPIRELAFRADGTFSVTWLPFETYKDYWGPYEYDADSGRLQMSIDFGNHIPSTFDGQGTASLSEEGMTLILSDMWLGEPYNSALPVGCGYRFERR